MSVETKKLKIVDGKCHGEFLLTGKTLIGGFYEVRAYTRAMLNWEGTVFSRVFPIFDRPETEGEYDHRITHYARSFRLPDYRQKQPDMEALNLSFYPEGGVLVAGASLGGCLQGDRQAGAWRGPLGWRLRCQRPIADNVYHATQRHGAFCRYPRQRALDKVKVSDGGSQRSFTCRRQAKGYTMTVDNLHGEEVSLTPGAAVPLPKDNLWG